MWGLQISALVVFQRRQHTPVSFSGQRLQLEVISAHCCRGVLGSHQAACCRQRHCRNEGKPLVPRLLELSKVTKPSGSHNDTSGLAKKLCSSSPLSHTASLVWGWMYVMRHFSWTWEAARDPGESALYSAPTSRPPLADLPTTLLVMHLPPTPSNISLFFWLCVSMCSLWSSYIRNLIPSAVVLGYGHMRGK